MRPICCFVFLVFFVLIHKILNYFMKDLVKMTSAKKGSSQVNNLNNCGGLFTDYPDILTVPEMAKMLRVGRNTAYDLVKSGDIQSVKVKNQIRIPKSSVIEFLKCG